ncbi:MAG: hypothetical protein IJF03_03470 [Lachnospiraceae bacterium]|nr:hypothetical protein [Lachnospiraceae bacterium]
MKYYYVTHDEKYAQAYYEFEDGAEKKCPKCGKICEFSRIGVYHTRLKGKKQGDFYHAPGCYIGNSKFLEMLVKYNITGYEIKDIVVDGWFDQRDNLIDLDSSDLKEIAILGKCGWYADKDGKEIKRCDKCGIINFSTRKEVKGIKVEEDTWDGSDIFSFSNWLGVMICTERLKEACEKEKIKNIRFIPLEEFTFA